jgi:hypothetical protein
VLIGTEGICGRKLLFRDLCGEIGQTPSHATRVPAQDYPEVRALLWAGTAIRGSIGQNAHNFQNRGNGISEIEGKGAMGSAEQGGSRASFHRRYLSRLSASSVPARRGGQS